MPRVSAHRLVFVNARVVRPATPPRLRRWLELMADSLGARVDETRYPEPPVQRVLRAIERARVSPEEAYLIKQEAQWEAAKREAQAEGEAKGGAKGRAAGEAEGRVEGLRAAVADLCEVLGVELDPARHARLATLGVEELEALRAALKQQRRWPPPER